MRQTSGERKLDFIFAWSSIGIDDRLPKGSRASVIAVGNKESSEDDPCFELLENSFVDVFVAELVIRFVSKQSTHFSDESFSERAHGTGASGICFWHESYSPIGG